MVKIKLESGWFLIENKILFWASVPNKDYINLAFDVGEDIVIEKAPYSIIEYPWEYDMEWIVIKVFSSKDGKLNYVITKKDKKIAIIQTPKILEEDEINNMYARLYMDDAVEKKLDQLELDWKKFKLDSTGWTLQVSMKDDENHQEISIKSSNTVWEDAEIDLE
jgi:hypothetical protein